MCKCYTQLFFSVDLHLAKLLEGPESTSTLLNEIATFNCSGFGLLIWAVDGVHSIHESLSGRGIIPPIVTTTNSGNQLSQLGVRAMEENNKINISCAVIDGTLVEVSVNATLTVLG